MEIMCINKYTENHILQKRGRGYEIYNIYSGEG